ncbi:MAG: NADP-specific glutamate dehydrogenase [Candidatus Edwardsbacteria bacterium]|nr:NADP-specific glutamate dehydrogenase [Candidatus Edwardsbacteria bacterium]MBU1577373.1 NADP-specific glutamate dehydrogenase [Candidatus Edwardsbacteria bacterium]MBU2463187.1 NADP-specific glutamate dehydrogenase [Candidatus Edwardsbacteria bacterium]MBU2594158.1 NADP-specific glutamate dehydrogenase [Candidatus Edwardsbacteria bacterium]
MSHITDVIAKVKAKNPGEPEFHQAVEEVMKTLEPTVAKHPEFVKWKIYERICEPDRVVMFRVPWVDDKGEVQVNKGFRVQFNNAIGPYKGGLRFHPSVNLGIIKFLGFEQVFKNSLTTLAMGGGKGGSDFDPKGKSDMEVMKFTQSFMRELFRHIGQDTDVPAGDIGVGGREIGYMYGYYKKIRNEFTGVLTGRAREYGGSLIRPEATGYGAVYFGAEMLATRKKDYKGLRCIVSGKGNVSQYTIEKITQLGGKALSICDSGGTIIDEEGIDAEKLKFIMDLENVRRGRAKEYADKYKSAKYYEGKSVWDVVKEQGIKFDCAFPSATQNEIDELHAQAMVKNGCFLVSEGANMPSNLAAIKIYQGNNVLYGPAKAANAGGVATSGLEMAQQSSRWYWNREEVDQKLQRIMQAIHQQCLDASETYATKGDYLAGANIAGFVKVAKAMVAQGVV